MEYILKPEENLHSLAEALANMKYDIVVSNLVVFCIAIISIYLITRLKKSAELKEINNNFENVKKQQSELVEVTGKLKQAFDQGNINYQIKLSAYHEKSINSIENIYISLVELRESAKQLGFNLTQEERFKFYNKIYEFRTGLDKNKIWIPSDLSQEMEKVAKEIEKRSTKFIIANKQELAPNLSAEKIDKINKELESFYGYISSEIDVVFANLVEKIAGEIAR